MWYIIAVENWRSKSTAVCHSNSIRYEKANDAVFQRLSELLANDKIVKEIIETINQSRKEQAEPLKKELVQVERKKRLFELYEDGHISREEFLEQKNILNEQAERIEEDRLNCGNKLAEGDTCISYELVQKTLHKFGEKIGECENQEKVKILLRLLIKNITMADSRNVDSIRIQINDDIIKYLSEEEDVPQKGMSSFLRYLQRILNFVFKNKVIGYIIKEDIKITI